MIGLIYFLLPLAFALLPPNNDSNQPNFRDNYRMGFKVDDDTDHGDAQNQIQSSDAISADTVSAALAVSDPSMVTSQNSSLLTGVIVLLIGAGVAGIAFSVYRFQKTKDQKTNEQKQESKAAEQV